MARYLSLDWDQKQLHIVAATTARGGARIQRAAVFTEEHSPNPAEAETLGKVLRERLKEAGIAPAPVLACVGRERVILKDLRVPATSPGEEPAIVRFQTIKELTEPPDEVVIDYTPVGEPLPTGEQRVLALVVRKELLATYQTLCQAAGLKLAALTPRPFATLACLRAVAGQVPGTPAPEPADAAVGIVTVADGWAEFSVARGNVLAFARPLTVGGNLLGEVRRNLSVYFGQNPQHPVRAVYVAGNGDQQGLRLRLQELLAIPVYALDPFAGADGADVPATERGAFAGAVGLLHARARADELPVNFAHPKQPKPPKDPNRPRMIAAAAAILLVLVGGGLYGHSRIAELDDQIAELQAQNTAQKKTLESAEEEAKKIKAVDEWVQSEVVWLDDLYNVTALITDTEPLNLTGFVGEPRSHAKNDPHVGQMVLKGIMTEDYTAKESLEKHLDADKAYRRHPTKAGPNTSRDRQAYRLQFEIRVDAEHRPPEKYISRIELPSDDESISRRRRNNRRGGRGGNPGGFGNGMFPGGMGGFGGFGNGFGGDQE